MGDARGGACVLAHDLIAHSIFLYAIFVSDCIGASVVSQESASILTTPPDPSIIYISYVSGKPIKAKHHFNHKAAQIVQLVSEFFCLFSVKESTNLTKTTSLFIFIPFCSNFPIHNSVLT